MFSLPTHTDAHFSSIIILQAFNLQLRMPSCLHYFNPHMYIDTKLGKCPAFCETRMYIFFEFTAFACVNTLTAKHIKLSPVFFQAYLNLQCGACPRIISSFERLFLLFSNIYQQHCQSKNRQAI